jgi:hypothetical protein
MALVVSRPPARAVLLPAVAMLAAYVGAPLGRLRRGINESALRSRKTHRLC